jgi:hypothetical protein
VAPSVIPERRDSPDDPAPVSNAHPPSGVHRRARGRPRNPEVMALEDFETAIARLGGVRPASRALGVTAVTLRSYRRRERPVSGAVAAALRRLLDVSEGT